MSEILSPVPHSTTCRAILYGTNLDFGGDLLILLPNRFIDKPMAAQDKDGNPVMPYVEIPEVKYKALMRCHAEHELLKASMF